MFLRSLYLHNFRNYAETEVVFRSGINLFSGDNGQGKTNLLEALSLLSTGRSFRTQHLQELIRHGESAFRIEADLICDRVPQTLTMTFDGKERKLQLNSTSYSSFTPLLGILPSVFFVPSDAELIDGAPSHRRRFLNLHLSQSDPLYVHHLLRYTRALKQRNCLLRKRAAGALSPWDAVMVPSGLYLAEARERLLTSLKTPFSLRYLPGQPIESTAYLQLLEKNRARDLHLGSTHIGPHRDDFSLLFEEKSARLFGSEGQKRLALAELKFAEWRLMQERLQTTPLFALDDFGLHLDEERKSELSHRLTTLGQVFLTAPTPLAIKPTHRVEGGAIIPIL